MRIHCHLVTLIPNYSIAVLLATNTDDFARQNNCALTLTVDSCARYPLVSDPSKEIDTFIEFKKNNCYQY